MPSYEDQGVVYDPHGATFENVGRRKPVKITIPEAKPEPVRVDTSAEEMFRRQNPGR